MQYCYSFENDGPGYLVCQFQGGNRPTANNTIQYSVSQDDGQGGITLYSSVEVGRGTMFEQRSHFPVEHDAALKYSSDVSDGPSARSVIPLCLCVCGTVILPYILIDSEGAAMARFLTSDITGLVVQRNILVAGPNVPLLLSNSNLSTVVVEDNAYSGSAGFQWAGHHYATLEVRLLLGLSGNCYPDSGSML